MEQRYHAVMEVISDAPVTEVGGRYGVTRQAVHNWLAKHRTEAMMSSRPCADGSDLRAGAAAQTFLIAACARVYVAGGNAWFSLSHKRRACMRPGPVLGIMVCAAELCVSA